MLAFGPSPALGRKIWIAATVAVVAAASIVALHVHLYKTWGNNEHYYVTSELLVAFCDMALFQPPQNCATVEIGQWCRGEGGAWNASSRECDGISGHACRQVLRASISGQSCHVPISHALGD